MAIDNETLLNRLTAQRKTLTPQRLQIYRVLEDGGEPLTAYELQERVNRTFDESLNISTIYESSIFGQRLVTSIRSILPTNL